MRYKLHNWFKNEWIYFNNWWDLIGWLAFYDPQLKSLAHSKNDIYSRYVFKFRRVLDEPVDYATIICDKV
ncbi:MAG: hypothetical protein ACOC3V_04080, partial [bacterium]